MNLIRVLNEVIDLDEVSTWRMNSTQLLLSFRNGATITVELRDQREAQDLSRLFQVVQHKKTV